jgi:hypothetical protein
MRRFRRALGLVAALVLGIAAAPGLPGAQDFVPDPLVRQYFRVELEPAQSQAGRPRLRGYLYNLGPYDVSNVRLAVQALDARGAPVGAPMTGWVNGDIPANSGRRYFDLRLPGGAADYRVTVQSYTILDAGSSNL